jgi:hypothetical protein
MDNGDAEVRHFFFVAKQRYGTDLCDSAFLTMYPDTMAYIRKEYPYHHPQTKTSYTRILDKEDMDDRRVPKSVIEEYSKRIVYSKYLKALSAIQRIFEELVETYGESWVISSRGTVVCNYALTPFSGKINQSVKSLNSETNSNCNMFKAVEHFITLQKLPVGEPIPEEINEFIEQYNALKLLEG